MVTFTTLAESKCSEALSQHCSPSPGSSTPTATAETLPRSALSISRDSPAASEACEDDQQMAEEAATALAEGTATNPSRTATHPSRLAPSRPRPGIIALLTCPPASAATSCQLPWWTRRAKTSRTRPGAPVVHRLIGQSFSSDGGDAGPRFLTSCSAEQSRRVGPAMKSLIRVNAALLLLAGMFALSQPVGAAAQVAADSG